ncbi:MAG: TIR domain-containing protein [Nitrospira sp.]|nr:TIR domain-containing protein [Nitrospira sp.]
MGSIEKVSCATTTPVGDIVFLHGLGGDKHGTWQATREVSSFWPAWLCEELPQYEVYTVGYEAAPSKWLGTSMPLGDRARNILSLLDLEGLGHRPTVFVCHSLGGLVVKQMLQTGDGANNPKWKRIVSHTKGVFFLATPHSGSALADYLVALSHIHFPGCWGAILKFLRLTGAMHELQAHASPLRDLSLWYRNNVERLSIRTEVLFETQDTKGVRVVDETSADPGHGHPIPIDADHLSICKPSSRESQVFKAVRQFVQECLGSTEFGQAPSVGAASPVSKCESSARVNQQTGRIFISYRRRASKDARLASLLKERLQQAGCDVFIDVNMAVGTNWSAEIQRRIEWCGYLIVLLSEESVESEMLRGEVRLAHFERKQDGCPYMLPVRVRFSGSSRLRAR